LSLIRRHLPGYIETVWTEFLRERMMEVRGRLEEEESRVEAMIESDLTELVGSVGQVTARAQSGFGEDGRPMRVYVSPRRGKHRVSNVARGLSLHGYIMLFWAPPIGILSLAASQVVQRVYKEAIAEADRQAVVTSAVAASRELEREARLRIDKDFSRLSHQLKEEVAGAYRRGVERIEETLAEREAHRQDADDRRSSIVEILRDRLPRVRASLSGLDAEPTP
jgi:hypothetical protein